MNEVALLVARGDGEQRQSARVERIGIGPGRKQSFDLGEVVP